jgi:hypothetical protein
MKHVLLLSFLLVILQSVSSAQKVSGRLSFEQGQLFEIRMQVKTTIAQQAMGQAIDFNVDANATHSFKVTNTTEDNNTLHHQVQHISFSFDGMGSKRSFDSKEEKDLNGQFGKPIKDILSKQYDLIVDTAGKTLLAMPETVQLNQVDNRMAIVISMLKEVLELVEPPKKGSPSFFKTLPDNETGKGDTWTHSYETGNGKVDAAYVITDINDSTILIDFVESSVTVTKAEMMGSETTITMNNKSKGKIVLDRVTGIIR